MVEVITPKSTLNTLIKGFKANVKAGYQTTLMVTDTNIYLSVRHPQGYVGSMKRSKANN